MLKANCRSANLDDLVVAVIYRVFSTNHRRSGDINETRICKVPDKGIPSMYMQERCD